MDNLLEFKSKLEARISAAKSSNEIWKDELSAERIRVLSEVAQDFEKIYSHFEIFLDIRNQSIQHLRTQSVMGLLSEEDIRYLDGREKVVSEITKLIK